MNDCFFVWATKNKQTVNAKFVVMDIPYFKTDHAFDKQEFVFESKKLVEGEDKNDIMCKRVLRAFDNITSTNSFGLIFCSFEQAQMIIERVKEAVVTTHSQIFVYRGKLTGPPRTFESNQLPRNTVETAVIIKKGAANWASFQPFKTDEDAEDPTDLGNLFLSPRDFEKYPTPTTNLPFRKPADLLAKFLEAYSIIDEPVVEAFSGKTIVFTI